MSPEPRSAVLPSVAGAALAAVYGLEPKSAAWGEAVSDVASTLLQAAMGGPPSYLDIEVLRKLEQTAESGVHINFNAWAQGAEWWDDRQLERYADNAHAGRLLLMETRFAIDRAETGVGIRVVVPVAPDAPPYVALWVDEARYRYQASHESRQPSTFEEAVTVAKALREVLILGQNRVLYPDAETDPVWRTEAGGRLLSWDDATANPQGPTAGARP